MSNTKRKVIRGKVLSDSMDKTVVVEVKRRMMHKLYKKIINRSKKYYVHDEKNECIAGDIIDIIESRPFSKLKRWKVLSKVKKNGGVKE